jgi:hypothetical protein
MLKAGYGRTIGVDTLKTLAKVYLTAEEFAEIFPTEVDTDPT